MYKHVTFAQVDALLEKLGFEQTVIPGSHVNYRREAGDTPLMVQIHKPREVVPHFVLTYLQRELEWQGVIESGKFEQMLKSVAA